MNKTLRLAAENILKNLLLECTEDQKTIFKRMYCHKNLELPINDGVDQISDDKIDWAITQCERSVVKNRASII
jgi:hypothetical protein